MALLPLRGLLSSAKAEARFSLGFMIPIKENAVLVAGVWLHHSAKGTLNTILT